MSLDEPNMCNEQTEANGNATDSLSQLSLEGDFCDYIMRELLPEGCGITVSAEDDLLTIGYLDSMQFMRLVQYTEETYSMKIPAQDLLIENFQTVRLLSAYVATQKNG